MCRECCLYYDIRILGFSNYGNQRNQLNHGSGKLHKIRINWILGWQDYYGFLNHGNQRNRLNHGSGKWHKI